MKKLLPIILLSLIFSACTKNKNKPKSIGGDQDNHGCLTSAGYLWCPQKQACLRPWEEPCDQPYLDFLVDNLRNKVLDQASSIQNRQFNWQLVSQQISLNGRGFTANKISQDQRQSIESYFESQRLRLSVSNTIVGVASSSTGYQKAPVKQILTISRFFVLN